MAPCPAALGGSLPALPRLEPCGTGKRCNSLARPCQFCQTSGLLMQIPQMLLQCKQEPQLPAAWQQSPLLARLVLGEPLGKDKLSIFHYLQPAAPSPGSAVAAAPGFAAPSHCLAPCSEAANPRWLWHRLEVPTAIPSLWEVHPALVAHPKPLRQQGKLP